MTEQRRAAWLNPDDVPLDAQQVAIVLGHKQASWFRKKRAELERDYHFPKPLPGCGNRWHAPAIRAWKNSHYAALFAQAEHERQVSIALELDAAAEALADRLGGRS